jgi:hypothetical protein
MVDNPRLSYLKILCKNDTVKFPEGRGLNRKFESLLQAKHAYDLAYLGHDSPSECAKFAEARTNLIGRFKELDDLAQGIILSSQTTPPKIVLDFLFTNGVVKRILMEKDKFKQYSMYLDELYKKVFGLE